MRKEIVIVLTMLTWGVMWGQQEEGAHVEGTVSYKSSQNIYIKFQKTDAIRAGDTLYVERDERLMPAVVVNHKSSISCVGNALSGITLDIDDVVLFFPGSEVLAAEREEKQPKLTTPASVTGDVASVALKSSEDDSDDDREESLRGRLTLSYYGNLTDREGERNDRHRMRYTYTMNGRNFGGSRFSADTYISYRHSLNSAETHRPTDEALKVYGLAVGYRAGSKTDLWLGRRYNNNIANIGAIDGLQFETALKSWMLGGFAGTRPDYSDYGFNADLLQAGAFIRSTTDGKHGVMMNTLSAVEQRNNGATDRRFAYFQHSNSLARDLYIFSSFELELFTREDGEPKSALHFTSIYFSMRYRFSRKLSVFASYDARNNVIYYETYKNFIDQLIEEEMRQGFRARINYRPWKYVTMGVNGGYRFQKDNPNDSKNLRAYVTHSRVPGLQASVTASAILLRTAYLYGAVYGVRLSRDIIKGKVYGQAEFRFVDYRYLTSDYTLRQKIAGLNLSWRMNKKLSFNVYYEGIFGDTNYSNIHFRTIRRL